jgi:hypothetical protein
MSWPLELNVALKEWATVCRAMASGRQMILLRKGGIYEAAGEFELENRQFVFFPTYVHQDLKMLKPAEHAGFEKTAAEPSRVELAVAGEVTDIWPVASRAAMDALDEQHVWTKPLIDMRFNYKPANPLYLLLVRARRLAEPVWIENTPAYAGCKSWVPLDQAVDVARATAVWDDDAYESRRQAILKRIKEAK